MLLLRTFERIRSGRKIGIIKMLQFHNTFSISHHTVPKFLEYESKAAIELTIIIFKIFAENHCHVREAVAKRRLGSRLFLRSPSIKLKWRSGALGRYPYKQNRHRMLILSPRRVSSMVSRLMITAAYRAELFMLSWWEHVCGIIRSSECEYDKYFAWGHRFIDFFLIFRDVFSGLGGPRALSHAHDRHLRRNTALVYVHFEAFLMYSRVNANTQGTWNGQVRTAPCPKRFAMRGLALRCAHPTVWCLLFNDVKWLLIHAKRPRRISSAQWYSSWMLWFMVETGMLLCCFYPSIIGFLCVYAFFLNFCNLWIDGMTCWT